jgi:hypothetical protein
MTELSLTRFSKAILLSSRPTSEEIFTENFTAFAGLPTWLGIICALVMLFCRVAIFTVSYTVCVGLPQVPMASGQGLTGRTGYPKADMSLALVYAVCIGFFLIQVLFFAGGALESNRGS